MSNAYNPNFSEIYTSMSEGPRRSTTPAYISDEDTDYGIDVGCMTTTFGISTGTWNQEELEIVDKLIYAQVNNAD